MIGTRLDDIDATRLLRGKYGWWFIGNGTWTLISQNSVSAEGEISGDSLRFLHEHGAFQPVRHDVFSLTVLTSTSCNLACQYCFQNTAISNRKGSAPARIPSETLRDPMISRILEFTKEAMIKADTRRLFLLLFGGEPLLNIAACLSLLSKSKLIGLESALMATNAVLLSRQTATELESCGLTGIQVTLDGDLRHHDTIRVTKSNKGTFNTILSNLIEVNANTKLNIHIRINISQRNIDGLTDLVEFLCDKSFDVRRISISFAWIGDAGIGYSNTLQRDGSLLDIIYSCSVKALEKGFGMSRPSMKSTCQICSTPGGKYGAVINADGKLYSCWQSAGKKDYCVGDITNGYNENEVASSRWVQCGYDYKQPDLRSSEEFTDTYDSQLLDFMYERGMMRD